MIRELWGIIMVSVLIIYALYSIYRVATTKVRPDGNLNLKKEKEKN